MSNESICDSLRPRESVVHDQAAIDDECDADRRPPRFSKLSFKGKVEDGYVDCCRLAGTGREIKNAWPNPILRYLLQEAPLPREWLVVVYFLEKGAEIVCR